MALIAAIWAAEEQDRIVDATNQMFVWDDEKSQRAFVEHIVRSYYFEYYERDATLELVQRDNAQLMTQIYLMTHDQMDDEEFGIELLLNIPNREHVGYKLILQELLKHQDDVWFKKKLAILITGRNWDNDIVFTQGNFASDFWTFEKFFPSQEWERLVHRKRTYGIW